MRKPTKVEIQRSFASIIIDRGREYFEDGRLFDIQEEADGVVTAAAQGSKAGAYKVRLRFRERLQIPIHTACTCPYEDQCKHGAALAIYLMEQSEATTVEELKLPDDLVNWLDDVAQAELDPLYVVPDTKARIFYLLDTRWDRGLQLTVSVFSRTAAKDGKLGAPVDYKMANFHTQQFAKYVNAYDRRLMTDIYRNSKVQIYNRPFFYLNGIHGARLLRDLLATGRCHWGSFEGEPLHLAAPLKGSLAWSTDKKGNQVPGMTFEYEGDGKPRALALDPPYYVNPFTHECGPVECDIPSATIAAILHAPEVAPEDAVGVRARLSRMKLPESALPGTPLEVERLETKPVPTLDVDLEIVSVHPRYNRSLHVPIPFARLKFDYAGVKVAPGKRDQIRKVEDGKIYLISRDQAFEANVESQLRALGWTSSQYLYSFALPDTRKGALCMEPDNLVTLQHLERFHEFADKAVPNLRQQGWLVHLKGPFRYVGADEIKFDLDVDSEASNDWFEFKLGIRIKDRVIDLRSILPQLLPPKQVAKKSPWAKPPPEMDPFITLDDGTIFTIPRARIEALLRPLAEIFGEMPDWPDELRIPKSRLLEAEDAAEEMGVSWRTNEELDLLRRQLSGFAGLEQLAEPTGFTGTLRDYQKSGLAWLQFLREFNFGGILADDMGLGKTVQVLAHIQIEKLAGRLDRPCLVVAPTSTLPNWRREAERFVPGIKVVTLQGARRTEEYGNLEGADIALTNYAILARDKDELIKHKFHLVILDEAQNIKNSTTAAAKAARDLDARHRLCLSGTPVENHLDELWSLYQFLMPGFLGNQTWFRKHFRTPIEHKGSEEARATLLRRIRPFMLRRTKQEVVLELPSKTEIIETVLFGDAQRDLYESMRTAMDAKIRALLSEMGLNKSRIHILDALLKLRQVCCDPRLVKLPSARQVEESAKLQRLMEMLEVLLEDGRKVLLFSQFTSMLDLIEEQLKEKAIPWVRISGDTVDRDTPVQSFQNGEVPLFLISLKAGGTGLNLVAADTVIHYDPWWNPAVERQATDRAYRIGQDKPVMVYKLVTAGTVEEKIIELQLKKGALADSVLNNAEDAASALSQDDLTWLLET